MLVASSLRPDLSQWRRSIRVASEASVLLEDPEILGPRPNRRGVLPRHRARDLGNVRDIVHYPGPEQLTHGHCSQLGMLTGHVQILVLEIPAAECGYISRAQLLEFLQPVAQGPIRVEFREAVERLETGVAFPFYDGL